MNERWQLAERVVWVVQGWHTVGPLKQVEWPRLARLALGSGCWAETTGIVAGSQTAACAAGAADGSEFVHMLKAKKITVLNFYVQEKQ